MASTGLGSTKTRCGQFLARVPGRATAAALLLLMFYTSSFKYLYNHPNLRDTTSSTYLSPATTTAIDTAPPTNLRHIVFAIAASSKTWVDRKAYLESWWRPNVTRGYLFLDKYPEEESLLCPNNTCPTIRINEDVSGWEIFPKMMDLTKIRIVRSLIEAFRLRDQDVRWFVLIDDDTVLFVDNIVEVLSKYDHTKYFYLGSQGSETIFSNAFLSFDMGFGGAGFALSYPLVAALSKTVDGCFKRYPNLYSSDYYLFTCISDLGVAISPHKGFHQIDLRGDLSGFLSSHPQSPLLSLHHINVVDPIFPNMNRAEAIHHLYEPAKLDQSRLLQQFICYHHEKSWSVSVSWGYSAHVYENMLSRVFLRKPIETFGRWNGDGNPVFIFNTRGVTDNSCEAPHVFFFDSVEVKDDNEDPLIVTIYKRARPRGLETCSVGGNHSAEGISKIQVFSPAKSPLEAGRIECCDIAMADDSTTTVTLRPCMEAEEIV